MQIHERKPTIYEIAEFIDSTVAEVELYLANDQQARSLDAPISTDPNSDSLLSVLENTHEPAADAALERDGLFKEIRQSLQTLTPRERQIVIMFYGLFNSVPQTLDEIAIGMEVSRERVRQIKEKAMRRMKHSSRNSNLKKYLG